MMSIRATALGWVRTVIMLLIGLMLIFVAPLVLSAMALYKMRDCMRARFGVSRAR